MLCVLCLKVEPLKPMACCEECFKTKVLPFKKTKLTKVIPPDRPPEQDW
jgi:hypothetical protein